MDTSKYRICPTCRTVCELGQDGYTGELILYPLTTNNQTEALQSKVIDLKHEIDFANRDFLEIKEFMGEELFNKMVEQTKIPEARMQLRWKKIAENKETVRRLTTKRRKPSL